MRFSNCLQLRNQTDEEARYSSVSIFLSLHFGRDYSINSRSQCPSGLRQVLSSAARTLGSQVRILLWAWMFVCVFLCCVVLCR
jgi:hypothetical protein